jgi:UDP-glucose 4-epimerase
MSEINNKWVAITGSAGYIGSVLAKHCKGCGYNVLGIDIVYGSEGSNVYYNKHAYIDVAMGACISSYVFTTLIQYYGIDTIFHLAASADVKQSQETPMRFYENNVGNTAAMLQNLSSISWKGKIIYSSTAAVYEESNTPVAEESEKKPPNYYGDSKLKSEKLFDVIYERHGISSTVFRYFNVAGARGDVGDRPETTHIIPIMCKSAFTGTPFFLFGNDYDTRDGTAVRDYIDVNDVCRAHFHASDFLDLNPGVHIFNLGTSIGTSLNELIHTFEDVNKIDLQYILSGRREGDPGYLVADPSKFINETGFFYQSSLNSIIKSSWDFYCYREEKNGI